MPAAFIEKAGMELVGTFVKTVGLEAGKRVINGKPQKPKENHLTTIKEVKESVEIVNCSYDWEAIECNIDKVSEYAKLLAPVAGATMAGFFSCGTCRCNYICTGRDWCSSYGIYGDKQYDLAWRTV